jgi:hypothetical protein
MKIAVIGANGKTGRVFVKAALEAGHEVIAGIHKKNSFLESAHLTVKNCDSAKVDEIISLVDGCDVIVSLIGHGRNSSATLQTDAITNILKAMHTTGIKRVISLTGNGVRMPEDKIGLIDRLMNESIAFIDPQRISDGIRHAEILRASSVEYSIIRVLKLTNGPLEPFSLMLQGPAKIFVSRRSVANAILDIIEKNSYITESPIIGRA